MRQLKITHAITNRDSGSVDKYFSEVSKEPLLTVDEEIQLARRIKQGDQVALQKLIKANLRFVVSVAKQYQYSKMPFNDLINEGNIGLIKAAQMFDETRGFKFISYAVWWIRQSIMQALAEHSRLVRIPVNKVADLSKINQASAVIEQKFEREATYDELAEFLDIKVEDIFKAQTAALTQTSLDAPFGEDDSGSLLDIVQNLDAEPSDNLLDDKFSLKVEIERLLSNLPDREKEIMKRFFGIGYDYSQTLEDIANELSLTRERVRQIKEKAIRKLRITKGMLQPYL